MPLLFEEEQSCQSRHLSEDLSPAPHLKLKGNMKEHLVVLVHGFQGNQFDMRLLRIHLNSLFPHNYFLSSRSNEQKTSGDIQEMGERLSLEVRQHLQSQGLEHRVSRISFVGHSLGGVIIRAALGMEYLQSVKNKLHVYLSLSSPHVGYLHGTSGIVNTGMWFI